MAKGTEKSTVCVYSSALAHFEGSREKGHVHAHTGTYRTRVPQQGRTRGGREGGRRRLAGVLVVVVVVVVLG
jgi:hypothetical protein